MIGINFFFLLIVSMIILYFLKKTETTSRNDVLSLLKNEQEKLHDVLNELSNVATVVYSDIENKEENLRKLLDEANEKIEALNNNVSKGPSGGKNSRIRKRRKTGEENVKNDASYKINSIENKKIFELADKGFNILDISKIVNKQKGEVELILNLRKVREGQYVER